MFRVSISSWTVSRAPYSSSMVVCSPLVLFTDLLVLYFISKSFFNIVLTKANIKVNQFTREMIIVVDPEKVKALRNGTAGRKRGYWSPEDNERLIWMFNEQYGITEMAVTFGRTEKAIISQLDKLHMYDRVRAANKPKDGCRCPECPKYAECKEKGPLCT